MKDLFLKIANFGIKPQTPADIAEQIKLVNGISFLGVPVCMTYVVMFGATGYYYHTLAFFCGILIFTLPLFLNKWLGLNVGRIFISIMAPIFFGTVSVLSGKDLGFYLGFLVIVVPPIIIFPVLKEALFYVIVCISFLILSIIGNAFITPLAEIPFAMGVFLLNLFVVVFTSIAVVVFFKIELIESREKLFEKNKEMTDSINYAKKIQNTLLAHNDLLIEQLPEHFVLFKPKDIVSGDFYWATEHHNKFYLAVCDSTGHGVPGAFMCLLNIGFLSEAIKEKNIEKPNEVFTYVRKRLIESISKDGQQDGMDGILVCFEKLENGESKITYSGANNAPVLIHNNEIQILKSDKMPVGKGEKPQDFTLYSIDASAGDVLYLYTDGYADQFGGPKGKKFKYKPLNDMLVSMNKQSVIHQSETLDHKFEDWRGNLEQVDDVTIVGIRLY